MSQRVSRNPPLVVRAWAISELEALAAAAHVLLLDFHLQTSLGLHCHLVWAQKTDYRLKYHICYLRRGLMTVV